jgi:hypothetical protein
MEVRGRPEVGFVEYLNWRGGVVSIPIISYILLSAWRWLVLAILPVGLVIGIVLYLRNRRTGEKL